MTKLINVGYRWTDYGVEGEKLLRARDHWVNPDHIVHVTQEADNECHITMIPDVNPRYVRTACGINELLSMLQ